METRFSDTSTRRMALGGAIAWLVLAIAWQVSHVVQQQMAWEGLPQMMFLVGLVALLLGGLALAGLALNQVEPVRRPKTRIAGGVLLVVGLGLSVIVGWAVPLWTAVYGLAFLTLAWSGAGQRAAWLIGFALIVSSMTWFVLSALEIGAADAFGDYPIAWVSSTWIAGLGTAIGLVAWSRALAEPR